MEPKTKDQLIQELRERVYALEEIESDRDAIERELSAPASGCSICSLSAPRSSTQPRLPVILPAPMSARISRRSWAIRRSR